VSEPVKPTDPPTDGPPCPGCHGPHDLRACADLRGAAVLRAQGRLMSAVEVERRAGGAK
jgi:hypothetical protein